MPGESQREPEALEAGAGGWSWDLGVRCPFSGMLGQKPGWGCSGERRGEGVAASKSGSWRASVALWEMRG